MYPDITRDAVPPDPKTPRPKNMKPISASILLILFVIGLSAQTDPYKPDFSGPAVIPGMKLTWNDEFNITGKPDTSVWRYESGFVRNNELQWYQDENAICRGGVLLIEGRREKIRNPGFEAGSNIWRRAREYA